MSVLPVLRSPSFRVQQGAMIEVLFPMGLITTEDGPADLSISINALIRQLKEMQRALEDGQMNVRSGQIRGLRNTQKILSDVKLWLRIALEAEAQLEKRSKQDCGFDDANAVNLADARVEIGGRLDRIRKLRSAK